MDWTDDPNSSVDIVQTAVADLRGMARLSRDLVSGRIPVDELRAALARGPLLANFLALLITAVANTAANRRFTFGIQSHSYAARHHFEGLLVFGIGLALTSGALAVLHGLCPAPAPRVEIATVTAANLAATTVKFLLFRPWSSSRGTASSQTPPSHSFPKQKRPSK